ncbi:EF-hand domain-containing protein [Limnoglobus roseus]|uniref:EF-hand domain-containing protein n=1 Tax=Limnoglobus roseus TaxID=2598579 RepID=A0A5C1AUU4_9BACT|nr:EF-hand domain-containing protein [Limnoglobus roseus]QEL20466.1 hypothetical protein PX52LOC_07567 [Limnoglobus roseus]QEL20568.1 hypothetical protein PX52LOC_07673 [Limnoglobus roseus]
MVASDKAGLSAPRRALVELVQERNFGRVEHLPVRGGEPVLDPPPRVVREVKLGGENDPRPERALANFRLKRQWVELFELFDAVGDGTVDVLEFKNGLPFKALVADPAR